MASTGSACDIVFRGTDGTEAEDFIAAIERLAFTEGWSEDHKRMLLFARSCLRHKALRWFARLDPSKKNDWDLFVEALFDQYPLIEPPTEAEISTPVWSATTFSPSASIATLPTDRDMNPHTGVLDERHVTGVNARHSIPPHSKTYDPSILGRQLGILRIVVEDGTSGPQYVWRGRRHAPPGTTSWDLLRTTIDRQEALVVCFIPTPEPHPIGCLVSVCVERLAYKPLYAFIWNARDNVSDLIIYYSSDNDLPEHKVYIGDGIMELPKKGRPSGSFSKVWNVASNGSLEASLYANDPNNHSRSPEDSKTSEVRIDTSGTSIRFVKAGTPLWQDDPKRNTRVARYDFKARIVFEPF